MSLPPVTLKRDGFPSRYQTVAFAFYAENIPDAAGTAIASLGGNEYILPFDGWIIGIGVAHNADLTGGVITWNPTIDGTANTGLAAVTEDTIQRDTGTARLGAVGINAGQRLGVKWTETGTVAPTTTDVTIVVLVMFAGMSF